MRTYLSKITVFLLGVVSCTLISSTQSQAAVLNDYCNVPPFVAQSVPPLVLLTAGRDHKLYYEAFNEAMDLDEDGRVDIGYMHNIDYYGYFDSYKCYTYNNTTGLYSPASTTADKFCTSGQWSGNVLNWLTMSRMDVLRKVLYGGHRSTDTTASTILERVYVPGDAHSWGKEIPGGLCGNGSIFKNTCYDNSDCDTGYTCTDKSLNLIGMARADNSVCAASAVTWSSTTAGKILVAKFWAQAGGAVNGPTHADLLDSYYTDGSGNTVSPLSLIDMAASGNPAGTSTKVTYINNFNDSAVDPDTDKTEYTNLLAVTAFTTKNDNNYSGIWQFAVDGDDGVEVEILPVNKLPVNPVNWIVAKYYGAHGACFSPTATKDPNNTVLCNSSQSSLNNGFFNSTLTAGNKYWSWRTSSGSPSSCTLAIDANDSSHTGYGYCVNGGISLLKNTKYYMIVRQTNGTSKAGMKVWYRKPLDGPTAWNIFGANSDLTLSSPTIVPGNECSIRFKAFVDKADTTTGENRQHLFCSTTRSVAGTPVLRLLKNRLERKWDWASKERPVCADYICPPGGCPGGNAGISLTVDASKADVAKIWDYTVRNEVCKSSLLETNCRSYKSGSTTTYKPAGLLQKYGEGDGSKVCSRTYSKTCTTDANCTNTPASGSTPALYEGLCIDRASMYFGLMTDSYVKNLSGGVLRKDIWSLSDEINMATGQFIVPPLATAASFSATFPQGGIIPTFEAFRTVGFQYSDNSYSDTVDPNNGGACGWIVNNPLGEGKCRMWGNPIGEMMYEGLRYLAGKTAPTASFIDTSAQDGSLPIYRQDWGVVRGSNIFRPYGDNNSTYPIFPSCSKPFMLVLSDENVSYDSDSIPGSKFSTFTEDAGLPKLNINAETMADIIGSNENIQGQTFFIGETTTLKDFMCTAKTVSKLSLIRGLCPEEPTKEGSYYSAAVAYYGKTLFKTNTGRPNVTTYSLVQSSPVPKMTIRVNGKDVILVPVGKSISGGGVESSCKNRCTFTVNALGSLVISGCSAPATPTAAGSFCPSNQIVDFYVDTMLYDNNNAPPYTTANPAPNVTYAKFRINFEDVEQGADHDMDAISTYEICTGATCSPALTNANQLKVSVSSDYAAGGINQVMGFVISGTTEDAPYLVVRDSDSVATESGLTLDWEHTFSVSSSGATASLLHNPLWYAAKWGGFVDGNAPTDPTALATYQAKPDITSEWDKDGDGIPDNYYLVVNPLKLEQQLDKALSDILKTTSSGTAASIVNNSGEAGTNMLQAVFFPQKEFGDKKVSWIGEMQNMWFYLDPYLNANAIREDTVADKILDMNQDYKVTITFDANQSKTVANRFSNKGVFIDQISLDSLSPLWRAGELLYLRTTARTLKTSISGTALIDFADANKATLKDYLQAADTTEATKIINWVHGVDTTSDATIRSRSVSYNGQALSPWRLGDIISSTPKVQSSSPMQGYDLDYNDITYKNFWMSNNYKSRGMVYVGANDGMLHAFKLGLISKVSDASHPTQVAKILPNDGTLGQEEWAYIPKNALPYLKYMMLPDYSHLYTVDATSRIIDVSINAPTGCSSDYWDCTRKTTQDTANTSADHKADLVYADTSWRTVLIGGMGLGGATRPSGGAACTDCVKAPIVSPTGYESLGLSSYFALDVSEPTTPSLMWEFTDPALGYTLTPPAIVRINGKKGGTGADKDDPDKTKNGRWFAVFGSGPTGPINTTTHQFYGKSDQTLKLFIVDLKTGTLLRTIDTGVAKAFAGSLTSNSSLDTDFWDASAPGNYSHDVVYIGYSNYDTANTRWDGGVYRLVTNESTDPANWTYSKVIDGVGPVSTAVTSLQDRTDKKLWLFFGSGRYFYKDNTGIDDADPVTADATNRRYLYGIKEPCYPKNPGISAKNTIDPTCNTSVTVGSLNDQSDNAASMLSASATGWKIKLSASNTSYKSERLLTNPSASYNGNVTFTTFMPTADICGYGGQTFVWVVRGMSGAAPLASSLKGKLILQLSTGAFETVDLASALTGRQNRRTGTGDTSNATPSGGYSGGTSKDTPPEQKPPKGVPRILQIRER